MSDPPSGRPLIVVALFAIALSVLVLANETRYQGCVARQDKLLQINTAAKQVLQKPPKCSRVPFAAG